MSGEMMHGSTHSALDLFEKLSVLVNFEGGNEQEIFPVAPLDGPNIEFSFKTDRNVFLDLRNLFLELKV